MTTTTAPHLAIYPTVQDAINALHAYATDTDPDYAEEYDYADLARDYLVPVSEVGYVWPSNIADYLDPYYLRRPVNYLAH